MVLYVISAVPLLVESELISSIEFTIRPRILCNFTEPYNFSNKQREIED